MRIDVVILVVIGIMVAFGFTGNALLGVQDKITQAEKERNLALNDATSFRSQLTESEIKAQTAENNKAKAQASMALPAPMAFLSIHGICTSPATGSQVSPR